MGGVHRPVAQLDTLPVPWYAACCFCSGDRYNSYPTVKSLRQIDYLGLSAALSANGCVVHQDLSEDPETFHFDFTLPDGSLLIQAYPDVGLVLIVEWPEIGDPDELRFDRFPDPWEVSVNAYERFWEVARPYLSAD
jgi:hypothetical protein